MGPAGRPLPPLCNFKDSAWSTGLRANASSRGTARAGPLGMGTPRAGGGEPARRGSPGCPSPGRAAAFRRKRKQCQGAGGASGASRDRGMLRLGNVHVPKTCQPLKMDAGQPAPRRYSADLWAAAGASRSPQPPPTSSFYQEREDSNFEECSQTPTGVVEVRPPPYLFVAERCDPGLPFVELLLEVAVLRGDTEERAQPGRPWGRGQCVSVLGWARRRRLGAGLSIHPVPRTALGGSPFPMPKLCKPGGDREDAGLGSHTSLTCKQCRITQKREGQGDPRDTAPRLAPGGGLSPDPCDQELDTELCSLQPLLPRPLLLSGPGPRTTYLVAREFHRERLGPALQLHRLNLGSTLRSLWPELAGSCAARRGPDRESSDSTSRHWGTLVPSCSADRKGGLTRGKKGELAPNSSGCR
ncbi:hypothetical protein NN561_002252 [Cricetulus griseus]